MAVSQYIGARYVPLIYQNPDDNSNTWKQGVTYDPLTIVSYAGGSYTSKTFVPATASNPIDAPEYWVSIGLYSGQTAINTNSILQIRHALANATEAGYVCTTARHTGDIVWINGVLYRCTANIAIDDTYTEGINITLINDFIHDAAEELNEFNGRLNDAEGSIGDLEEAVGELTDLTNSPYTLCIGDSYAEGYTPDGNNSGWPHYLLELGVRGESVSRGGAGFHYPDTDSRSFMNIITHAQLTAPDEDIRRIVLCAGYNDFKDRSNVRAHIRAFISYCRTRFVNAQIYIGFCGYAWSANEDGITASDMTLAIHDYEIACRASKAIFIPQVIGCLLGVGSSMASDYKHPNETGNRTIAEAIYAALNGCSYESSSDYTVSLVDNSAGVSGTLALSVVVKDGSCFCRARTSGFEVSRATAFDLHNVSFTPPHFPLLPAQFALKVGETFRNDDRNSGLAKNYYATPCYIMLNGPSVQLIMNIMNDAGNNYGNSKHIAINDSTYYTSAASF